MNIPIDKNRRWVAQLHASIDQLDKEMKYAIMKHAGESCASDLFSLCERYLGRKIRFIDDLVIGWNILRDKRNLKGRWEFEGNAVRGIFNECGCPLVRSGLVELHSVQCYCSQSMLETIFSRVTKKTVAVEIRRSVGRSDDVCEFLIKPESTL